MKLIESKGPFDLFPTPKRHEKAPPQDAEPEPRYVDMFSADALIAGEPAADEHDDDPKGAALLPLPAASWERGLQVLKALNGSYPDASIEEKILFDFVASQTVIRTSLADASAQLVAQMNASLGDHTSLQIIAKTLKDVIPLMVTVERRIEGGLSAAANLRAQRAFLQTHRKPTDE